MTGFNVTYQIVTEESAEQGDVAEAGFLAENVSFSEALSLVNSYAPHPGNSDVRAACCFTTEADIDYCTGEHETRTIHLPETVTPASRGRIAALLGARR